MAAELPDAPEILARANRTRDVELLLSAYAPDAVLRSPIIGRLAFRGHDDLRRLMTEVYGVARDVRIVHKAREGDLALLVASSRTWGVRMEDAFVIELGPDGLIRRNTVHIRPLIGLVTLALALGLRMLRPPGVMLRAARAADRH